VADALGATWTATEFHVRRCEIDYLKPFVWGDEVEASCRIERVGRTSMTQRYELAHARTGTLHAVVTMVIVNVDLSTGQPVPVADAVRAFLLAACRED
jgi:acyl-CoA thioester hydrolase